MPCYGVYHYAVYVEANERIGKHANVMKVPVGHACAWTILMTTNAFQGWQGGYISVYNMAGQELDRYTMTSSTPVSIETALPLGRLSFGWTAPEQTVNSMAFVIKDAEENTVYTFSGSSDELEEGIFFETNNTCGGSLDCGTPQNLVAMPQDEGILLTWDAVENMGYGYNIYRDGLLYRLIQEGTTVLDDKVAIGGHCYRVAVLCEGGENNDYSNESCATSGECYAPTDFTFEYTSNFKVKLMWQKPVPSEGLSGYYIYRKFGEDGTYQRIKLAGAGATSYTDNALTEDGDYYYQIYAYYQALDCLSAPAYWINDHNRFYLHVPYSLDGVNELDANSVAIFPNPTTGHFVVEGQGMSHVTVYNMMGQMIHDMECGGESVDINLSHAESGVYMVRVSTANGEITKRITIIR